MFILEKNFKIWIIFIYPFPAGGVQTRINPDSPSAKDLDNTGHLVGILQGADLMPTNNRSNKALGILKRSFYYSFSYYCLRKECLIFFEHLSFFI